MCYFRDKGVILNHPVYIHIYLLRINIMYNPFHLKLKKNKWEKEGKREREKEKKRRNIISKV